MNGLCASPPGAPQNSLTMKNHEHEEGTSFQPSFDKNGLLPAIATDATSGEILMVAWMNQDALTATLKSGEAHFWSRSRAKLWRKGEESGNTLRIVEMRTDCDQDVLWLRVNMGGAGKACHTGRTSCFYRVLDVDPSTGEASLRHG